MVLLIGLLSYSIFGQCDTLKNWSNTNLTEHLKCEPENWKNPITTIFILTHSHRNQTEIWKQAERMLRSLVIEMGRWMGGRVKMVGEKKKFM